jgi:NDP-sugar pyrophosphorylase family protein
MDDGVLIKKYFSSIVTEFEKLLSFNNKKNFFKKDEFAHITGECFIGKDTKILSGSYIEGPVIIGNNSIIGPNAYIRPYTIIGDHANVRMGVELKESVLLNNVKIRHYSYIGHSVIGKNANISAGFITAVRRLDNGDVVVRFPNRDIDMGRKFGCIVGDDVQIGINVSVCPGRIIRSGSIIGPNQCILKNSL